MRIIFTLVLAASLAFTPPANKQWNFGFFLSTIRGLIAKIFKLLLTLKIFIFKINRKLFHLYCLNQNKYNNQNFT
jgi:hypothetical protein